jgi:hypothetical protein
MSYINMDHAAWAQANITAHKKQKPTAAERRAMADHKGFFAAPDQLTPFQVRAFNILGIVGNGIYNAPIGWSGIIWRPRQMIVPWRRGLGTWDFMELTRFCFLCHDARIRGYIEGGAPGRLKLWLNERAAEGEMSARHPSLEEAVASWRADLPLDHSIRYSAAPLDQTNRGQS